MRLTWSREPRERGLAGVCQGERGKDLKLSGCRIAYVRTFGRYHPLYGRGLWYWVASSDKDGIPLRNTCGAPNSTLEDAQQACEAYVRECLKKRAEVQS